MNKVLSISKESITKAATIIDNNPNLRKGRESLQYDLSLNDKKYPPILILSEANKLQGGEELLLSDFGNSTKVPFDILKELGFEIEKKNITNGFEENVKIWIEKTLVEGRKDRIEGEYALGNRLWSPTKDKRGGDIYSLMRSVSEDDIVLHLTDNRGFTGVSKVKSTFAVGKGIEGTEWEGDAYIIELKNFTKINTLSRSFILNEKNRALLEKIKINHRVFYNSELNLNQGAYITECPIELAVLINQEYFQINGSYISFLPKPNLNFDTTNNKEDIIMFQIQQFLTALKKSNIYYSNKVITRFICSLITKPFVILTGLSGSGKTKLAQAFATWICESEDQYCMVPVGADWTNREPLLGFPNALKKDEYVKPDNRVLDLIIAANANTHKPYFLILDEMNLSHVERYFADFLSVMETKGNISLHTGSESKNDVPSEIKLPENLFIIGTVNIDETTYMFSPKVLDRSNVIEFQVTADEMKSYLSSNARLDLGSLKSDGANIADSFVQIATNKSLWTNNADILQTALLNFFNELKKTGAEFGYRSAAEIFRFVAVVNTIEPDWTMNEIIDAAIMQKLLPKVHGSRRKLEPVLKTLGVLCLSGGHKIDEFISSKTEIDFADAEKIKYPLSLEKILRMYHGLIDNGFTSYAEA